MQQFVQWLSDTADRLKVTTLNEPAIFLWMYLMYRYILACLHVSIPLICLYRGYCAAANVSHAIISPLSFRALCFLQSTQVHTSDTSRLCQYCIISGSFSEGLIVCLSASSFPEPIVSRAQVLHH